MKKENINKIKKYVLVGIIAIITIFVIYNILTIDKTYYKNEKNINISIFVYHNIVEDKNKIEYDYMQTSKQRFEEQLKGLKSLGYHFISYEDLIKYNKGEIALQKNTCIVTFDDGWDGAYNIAYPIAQKYNIPITLFVVNDLVGTEGYITWNQAKEMQDSGIVEIGSHSKDHSRFDNKTAKDAIDNVNDSYNEIKQKVNSKRKIFTYPCGLYTEEQINELAEQGYIQNLTDNKINNSSKLNLKKLHRCYPLNDNVLKIILKIVYRDIRYK